MEVMKGVAVSAKLKEEAAEELKALGRVPRLAIIRVGEKPDDISYEKGALKKMAAFGLEAESWVF